MVTRATPVLGLLLVVSPACSLILGSDDPVEEQPDAAVADASIDAPPPVVCETGWTLAGGGLGDDTDAITQMVTDGCDTFICGTYDGVLELFVPPPQSFGQGNEVVVARINATGEVVWMHGIGGSTLGGDTCEDLAVSSDSVAIVGDFVGTIQSPVDNTQFPSADRDGYVATFDRDTGEPEMFATLDGADDDILSAVAFDGDNLYLGGYASSAMPTFNGDQLTIGSGVFVLNSSSTGVVAEARAFGGTTPASRATAIVIAANDLFVGVNVADLETVTDGAACTLAAENTGAMVVKLSPTFTCLGRVVIDSTSVDTIEAMTLVDGRIIVAGNSDTGLGIAGSNVVDEGGAGGDGYYLELALNLAVPRLRIYGSSGTVTRFHSVAYDPTSRQIAILADFSGNWTITSKTISSMAARDLAVLTFPGDMGEDLVVEAVEHIAGAGDEIGAAARFRDGKLVIAGSYDGDLSVLGIDLPTAINPDLFVVAPTP